MKTEKLKLSIMQVRADITPDSLDEKERTIELTWSAGTKGLRRSFFGDYYEELSLEAGHVRMDRLNNGAPLLNSHYGYSLEGVIGVVERAWIDNKIGKAKVRFSKRDDVESVFQDVKDGIIRNVSVGYKVYTYEKIEKEENKIPTYRAIDWEPAEISLVPVGFDDSAKVRSGDSSEYECEVILTRENQQTNAQAKERDMEVGKEIPAKETVDVKKERQEAVAAERKRCAEVTKLCRQFNLNEQFERGLVESEKTIDECRSAIIDELAKRDVKTVDNKVTVTHGDQDEKQTRAEGMEQALLHRADPSKNKLDEKGRQYRSMSLLRMAEEFVGRDARGLTKSELATRALSSSDFPLILANVARKSLRSAYELQPRTFAPWTRVGTLPDYKEMSRLQMGEVSDLDAIPEGGEYQVSSLGENSEKIRLVKYGKVVAITEETIINDDLDAMSRIPALLGAAAARKESEMVYAILTGTVVMSDTVNLFHASHGNLAGAGTTITAGLAAARAAMRKQKGVDTKDFLDLSPSFLIVGPDKETEALQLMNGEILATKSTDVNIFRNSMSPIVESRITGNNWYLAASPSQIDTIEVAYLDGMQGPQISSKEEFMTDGFKFKIKHVFATKAIDFRGLYKNTGA